MSPWIIKDSYYDNFLREVLCSQQNWNYRDFPITPSPYTCIGSPISNILHQSAMFVTTSEPTLTYHHHLKTTVFLRVHSWSCTFYGFGQTRDNVSIIRVFSLSLKPSVLHLFISLLPPVPGNHWYLYCHHGFTSSRISYSWYHAVPSFRTFDFFH